MLGPPDQRQWTLPAQPFRPRFDRTSCHMNRYPPIVLFYPSNPASTLLTALAKSTKNLTQVDEISSSTMAALVAALPTLPALNQALNAHELQESRALYATTSPGAHAQPQQPQG